MSPSKIEWTEETWNPTTGCSKVSPGCAHCYAEALSKRYAGANGWPAEFKPWTPYNAAENVVLHPDRLEAPMHWKTPRRVFVDSMSDLFHEQIPHDFIDQVFAVMALTPQHTYQVLTKRPERMRAYFAPGQYRDVKVTDAAQALAKTETDFHFAKMGRLGGEGRAQSQWVPWPLDNVWLGVSAENQHWLDARIHDLLNTPAAIHFVSAEPLLGPLDFHPRPAGQLHLCIVCGNGPEAHTGFSQYHEYRNRGLDWVIVGGESGPKHRPFDQAWARSIVAQCSAAGVACFVKQLGGFRPGTALEDLPADLRVREYPA